MQSNKTHDISWNPMKSKGIEWNISGLGGNREAKIKRNLMMSKDDQEKLGFCCTRAAELPIVNP